MASLQSDYDFILAIDQGGHASRATVYSLDGNIVTSAICEVATQRHGVKGSYYIEHNASEIVASIEKVISECARYLGDTKKLTIKAGFATQRSTIVCWNFKTAEVLSPAISWQDTRAVNSLINLQNYNHTIKSKTGLFLSAHYGASKIAWCLENIDAVIQAKKNNELCIAPLSSYLLYSCVAGAQTIVDPANAARTLLFNQVQLDWDDDLLSMFTISRDILPRCVKTRYKFGQLRFWPGVCEVELCTGDQSAAVFSQGFPSQNVFTVNIGSGAFVLNLNKKNVAPARILSGSIYTDNKLTINAWEGTINGAGTALDWLQDQYPDNNVYQLLPLWLREIRGDIPLFINGISGVGSPFWKATLNSRFIGEATLASKAIAIVESIVFLITENINVMKTQSENTIKISGGLSTIDGLCQKIADLTTSTVIRAANTEATLQGVLFLLSNFKVTPTIKNNKIFKTQKNTTLFGRFYSWKKIMDNE